MTAGGEGVGSSVTEEGVGWAEKASLRRTFSVDMSFRKLAAAALKKVPSSEELSGGAAGRVDIWSSIVAEKERESESGASPAYVHPLVRRSSSSLTQKSLEVCTESLGSETGSDGFSSDFESCSSSDDGEGEDEEPREAPPAPAAVAVPRRSPPRAFPPPISRRHMRPHRRDGRLVLEAVPAAPRSCLHAERHGGRLLLTLVKTPANPAEQVEANPNGERRDATPAGAGADEPETLPPPRPCMVEVKLHKSVINKHMSAIPFRNPNPWSAEKKKPEDAIRLSPAAAFNAYDRSWKSASPSPPPPVKRLLPKQQNERPRLSVRTCKETRRTLLIWDSHRVAAT